MDILCLNIKLTFPMQSSVIEDAQHQHFSKSTAVIRSTTNGVMTLQPHPCHITTYALTILSTFEPAPFTLVHPLIIRCVMHHPCPIAPSFQHHHSCHLVLAHWTCHHVFTPLSFPEPLYTQCICWARLGTCQF